jgi:hypothetical protein
MKTKSATVPIAMKNASSSSWCPSPALPLAPMTLMSDAYLMAPQRLRFDTSRAVTGPVREMLEQEGQGRWVIKAQIGSSTSDVHSIELPETDEIVY